MSLVLNFFTNPLSAIGAKLMIRDQSKFTGTCEGFESSPECHLVLARSKPPFPRMDQFNYTMKVVLTDGKSYMVVQSCLDVDFLGFKYTVDTVSILTRDKQIQQSELDSILTQLYAHALKSGLDLEKYPIKRYDHSECD